MTKYTLPTYAIVELLIRLGHITPHIGNYKNHGINPAGILVKTTTGTIIFARSLIKRQFDDPELIAEQELKQIATSFKPAK